MATKWIWFVSSCLLIIICGRVCTSASSDEETFSRLFQKNDKDSDQDLLSDARDSELKLGVDEPLMQSIHSLKLSQDALQQEIEKFKEIGNETSSPDDDGSTKCRSEAAGPSAVDLEVHDSCSSGHSDKQNSSSSMELQVIVNLGYLLAGSLTGLGGVKFITELVQRRQRLPHWLIFSLIISWIINTGAAAAVFNVESYDNEIASYSYLGEANIQGSDVSLSNDNLGLSQQCVSTGALFYNSPLNFYDFNMNRPLSFHTTFRFSITTLATPVYFGDGISFAITPTISSPTTGLFAYPNIVFGVAVDTRLDPFGTPTDLYVQLFNGSSSAIASARFTENLRSGEQFTFWVDYDGITNLIRVYIEIGVTKPVEPLLITVVEALHEYLSSNHGTYFVGLTASSKGCTESYQIHSWAFEIEQQEDEQEQKVSLRHKANYETISRLSTLGMIASFIITVVLRAVYIDHEKMNQH